MSGLFDLHEVYFTYNFSQVNSTSMYLSGAVGAIHGRTVSTANVARSDATQLAML